MRDAATRSYRMGERAFAVERTRRGILDAAIELGDPRLPISAIAERAGVSERTILRHFGTRSGLTAAAMDHGAELVRSERFEVDPGDLDAAIDNLVGHYEDSGDGVVSRLGEEGRDEAIDAILENGRRIHREWVEEKLGPLLPQMSRGDRRRRLAGLVAVCDVYTWKLLRRDMGLGVEETKRALAELIGALTTRETR